MSETRIKAVITAMIVALAAATTWAVHVRNAGREQQREIAALVAEASGQLEQILRRGAGPEDLARAEERLARLRQGDFARRPLLADAAEHYLISAHTVVRESGEAARLAQLTADDRQALAAQITRRRNDAWFAAVLERKQRLERDYSDLARAYSALDRILDRIALDQRQLEGQHVGRDKLLDEDVRGSARKRVEADAAREAAELEKSRKLIAS